MRLNSGKLNLDPGTSRFRPSLNGEGLWCSPGIDVKNVKLFFYMLGTMHKALAALQLLRISA